MPKKIVQLADKFSKIIVRSQATVAPGAKKLVSPIRGKQSPAPIENVEDFSAASRGETPTPIVNPSDAGYAMPKVLVPNTLQKALSELVDVLRQIWEKNPALKIQSSDGLTEINTAWSKIIENGQEVSNGIMISPAVEPMLDALHHTFLFLKDVAKAPANDVSKATDVYQQFSTLTTSQASKTKSNIPYNEDVKIAQNHLWRNGYADALERAGGVDGKLGPATIAALKAYLPDYSTKDAIAYCIKREQENSQNELPTLPRPGVIHEDPYVNPYATTGVGNSDASRLADRFLAKLGKQ